MNTFTIARTAVLSASAVVIGALVLSGCSAPQPTSSDPGVPASSVTSASDSRGYLFNAVESRFDSTETVTMEQDLADLLPNQEFAVENNEAASLAGGIVFGTITRVSPGVAYTMSGTDDLTDVELPFTSPDAMWRVAVLTVAVDNGLGEDVAGDKTISVGYVIDGALDLDRTIKGLENLGTSAIVLNRQGKFAFDPELYSVRWSGALLGEVSDDKKISFPGLGHDSEEFVGDLDSVDDVVKASKKKRKVIHVDIEKNEYVRSDS
jgi:hypothetical protein